MLMLSRCGSTDQPDLGGNLLIKDLPLSLTQNCHATQNSFLYFHPLVGPGAALALFFSLLACFREEISKNFVTMHLSRH